MNKTDFSLYQRLAAMAYFTYIAPNKSLETTAGESFEKYLVSLVNDENYLKAVDGKLKSIIVGIADEELRLKLIKDSHKIETGTPFRNSWKSNGHLVRVISKLTSKIAHEEGKHQVDVKEIKDIMNPSFWSGGKLHGTNYQFRTNVVKGIAYIEDIPALKIVEDNTFSKWVEDSCKKFGASYNKSELATSLLSLIAHITLDWSGNEENLKTGPSLKIYYGPPGTGKTNTAKKKHIEILGDDLKQASNSYIVQIHPSYGYEDLVEGIKPVTYFNGEIKYQVVDGPVKIMARKANADKPLGILCCIKDGLVHLPFGTKTRYNLCKIAVSESDITATKKFNIDLNGDFFEITNTGIVVKNNEQDDCIFKMLYIWDAGWNATESYVLLLDEINRGHVATILGELVFALSEVTSEHPLPVKLQYSGDNFLWPKNLSLIGTMNTADTTTDRIDQAIKRRFEFVSVDPYESIHEWKNEISFDFGGFPNIVDALMEKFQIKKSESETFELLPWVILKKINKCLYNSEWSSQRRSGEDKDAREYGAISVKEKRIGHSYFIKYAKDFLAAESKLTNLEDKIKLAKHMLGRILKFEIYPSMLNIFNNNEEMFNNFKENKLDSFLKEYEDMAMEGSRPDVDELETDEEEAA